MFQPRLYRENLVYPLFEKIEKGKEILKEGKERDRPKEETAEGETQEVKDCIAKEIPIATPPIPIVVEKGKDSEEKFLSQLMKKIDRKIQKSNLKRKIVENPAIEESFPPKKKTKLASPVKEVKVPPRQLSKRALARFNKEFLPANLSKSQKRIKQIEKQAK